MLEHKDQIARRENTQWSTPFQRTDSASSLVPGAKDFEGVEVVVVVEGDQKAQEKPFSAKFHFK